MANSKLLPALVKATEAVFGRYPLHGFGKKKPMINIK